MKEFIQNITVTYQLKSLLHHHCRFQENQQLLKPIFKCRKALISSNYINFTLITKQKMKLLNTHTHTHTHKHTHTHTHARTHARTHTRMHIHEKVMKKFLATLLVAEIDFKGYHLHCKTIFCQKVALDKQYVICCAIRYHFYKNCEKRHWSSVTFSKVEQT